MFRDKLYQIQSDISRYSKKKDGLMEKYISDRLNIALRTYQKSLDDTVGYLERRDSLSVLSKVNRRVDNAKNKAT